MTIKLSSSLQLKSLSLSSSKSLSSSSGQVEVSSKLLKKLIQKLTLARVFRHRFSWNFPKFTVEHLWRSLLLVKLQVFSQQLKRNSGTGVLYLFHRNEYYFHLNDQKNVYRNSRSQAFFELFTVKDFTKFLGKPLCGSVFLNEIAVL